MEEQGEGEGGGGRGEEEEEEEEEKKKPLRSGGKEFERRGSRGLRGEEAKAPRPVLY